MEHPTSPYATLRIAATAILEHAGDWWYTNTAFHDWEAEAEQAFGN